MCVWGGGGGGGGGTETSVLQGSWGPALLGAIVLIHCSSITLITPLTKFCWRLQTNVGNMPRETRETHFTLHRNV